MSSEGAASSRDLADVGARCHAVASIAPQPVIELRERQ